MALDLARFFAGMLAFIVPGYAIAGVLRCGKDWIEQWIYGASIGLATAVCLGCAVSHIDLRLFYPLWAIVVLVSIVALTRTHFAPTLAQGRNRRMLLLIVLALVGITRFAAALPMPLPNSIFDPAFHMILARKIQLAHHAIFDWRPFQNAALNYPTGSHTFLALVSNFTRLPLENVFNDLMPFLGVLYTGQIYILARLLTQNRGNSPLVPLFAAAIYGLWTWYGGIGYQQWGGLPNEFSMLLLIAMFCAWLEDMRLSAKSAAMSILLAGLMLIHHHVMIAGCGIIFACLVVEWIGSGSGKARMAIVAPLLVAILIAVIIDAFFLIPYVLKIGSLKSTYVWRAGEEPIPLLKIPGWFGYALCAAALPGLAIVLIKPRRCHSLILSSIATLLILYIGCEYGAPAITRHFGLAPSTAFTPSRFLTDLTCFLTIPAAIAITTIQPKRLSAALATVLIIACTVIDAGKWHDLFSRPVLPSGFIAAAEWIRGNTPAATIVNDTNYWTTYLCWRRAAIMPIPISEPMDDVVQQIQRIPGLIDGQILPDSPDQQIVAITTGPIQSDYITLWQDPVTGTKVIQQWKAPAR